MRYAACVHEEDRQGLSPTPAARVAGHCLPKPPQSLPTVGILITQKFFCASSALLFTTLDGRP